MKRIFLILAAIVLTSGMSGAQSYIANRTPLLESRYMELPLGEMHP